MFRDTLPAGPSRTSLNMGETTDISISTSAELNLLRPLVSFIREVVELQVPGMSDAKYLDDVELVFSEAFTNLCVHAYPHTNSGKVEIRLAAARNRAELAFSDWGRPFDPHCVPEPDLDCPNIHGRGWWLIRRKVDRWSYRSLDKGENVLELTIGFPEVE